MEDPEVKSTHLIQTWMASTSNRDQVVREVVSAVADTKITLLLVVQSLGAYLTSEDDDLRTKGVEFLSSVIHQCSITTMNRQTVHALVSFYCGKLSDTETIVPALDGLVALSQQPSLFADDATEIAKALFAHVKMRALVQAVRYHVFVIIDTLLSKHREALKGMGAEFLSGYVGIADGEKDPRNLLIAFAIARVILIEFDISSHIEAFFNITFCYFPISFRPPPNDPYGITAEDLKSRLRSCLGATPAFGPLAIPLFLEKLTAGSPVTKRDTLETMTLCLSAYDSRVVYENGRAMWNSLKIEVFQPTDPTTEEAALESIKALVKAICAPGEDNSTQDTVQGLKNVICDECIQKLQEPEKSQAKASMKILSALVAARTPVSEYIISKTVPLLLKLFLDPMETALRPAIILLLCRLIDASHDAEVLLPYKDELVGVTSTGFDSDVSRQQALALLQVMVSVDGLLSDEEISYFIRSLIETFLSKSDGNDEFNERVLVFLSTVNKPRYLNETALPLLFSVLPDQAPGRGADAERVLTRRILSALSKLCIQPELFETLYIRLTTKFEIMCFPAFGSSLPVDTEPIAAYSFALLKAISVSIDSKVSQNHADIPKYVELLVPRLFNWFIFSATNDDYQFVALEQRLIQLAAHVIETLVQSSPALYQKLLVDSVYSAFFQGNFRQIVLGYPKIPENVVFVPFSERATKVQRNLVTLAVACFYPLNLEVALPVADIASFLHLLLRWGVDHAQDEQQAQSVWRAMSSILNKHIDDSASPILKQFEDFWLESIYDTKHDNQHRKNSIQAWIWVVKGLLRRSHPSSFDFAARLVKLFDDQSVGWDAALAIGEVARADSTLIKSNHAVLKILHLQKYVNAMLPLIVRGVEESSKGVEQTAYLVALSSLIQSVPRGTYMNDIPKLIPFFIRSLELLDANLRVTVIDTLHTMSKHEAASNSLSEHASTLVDIMLANSKDQLTSPARVRIVALRYLALLPSLVRYSVLHPQKARVLRDIACCLDDPRRGVRKEAVDARTVWYRYNG